MWHSVTFIPVKSATLNYIGIFGFHRFSLKEFFCISLLHWMTIFSWIMPYLLINPVKNEAFISIHLPAQQTIIIYSNNCFIRQLRSVQIWFKYVCFQNADCLLEIQYISNSNKTIDVSAFGWVIDDDDHYFDVEFCLLTLFEYQLVMFQIFSSIIRRLDWVAGRICHVGWL